MLKMIATFAAVATLAATTIAPAHAWISMNGGGENGTGENGIIRNGGGINGGGENGGGENGRETAGSSLSIQAFELPPETR
jgi:hypothetical protein